MLVPSLTITPAAEKFIRRMVRFSAHPAGGFRLTVAPGGCSGYSSEFSVEATPRDGDADVQVGATRLFLPAQSRLLLDGVTIDFTETPTSAGLAFINPNQAACGCSTSGDGAAKPAEVSVSASGIKRMAKA